MSSINESERIALFVPMDFSAEEFAELEEACDVF